MTKFLGRGLGLCAAGLVAAGMLACSGSENGAGTPTSPTPSSPAPAATTPPPANACPPAAPGNLRVTIAGSSRTFNWDAVSNAQDYFIQIGSASGASDLVNTNTSQTTYQWTGASPGNYWARVYARNSCGSGPNSAQLVFN